MTEQAGGSDERFALRVTADSHFAWLRTRLAIERTFLAWLRTAAALIGFGFTIVQFFERLHSVQDAVPVLVPQAPRYLGLSLILAGILALSISTLQYRSLIRYMWSKNFEPVAGVREDSYKPAAFGVAVLLLLIGIFAALAVVLHVA